MQCSKLFNSFLTVKYHIDESLCPLMKERKILEQYINPHKEGKLLKKNNSLIKEEDKSLTCSNCNKKLADSYSFKKHIYYCLKEIDQKCDYCNYMSKYRSNLNVHIKRFHSNHYKKGVILNKTEKKKVRETKGILFCNTFSNNFINLM